MNVSYDTCFWQCCGSGSEIFWPGRIRIRNNWVQNPDLTFLTRILYNFCKYFFNMVQFIFGYKGYRITSKNTQMLKKSCISTVPLCTSYIKIKKNVKKKSQNNRNQGFSYFFCLLMEGSGCVKIMMDPNGPKTYGTDPDPYLVYRVRSGSGSSKTVGSGRP